MSSSNNIIDGDGSANSIYSSIELYLFNKNIIEILSSILTIILGLIYWGAGDNNSSNREIILVVGIVIILILLSYLQYRKGKLLENLIIGSEKLIEEKSKLKTENEQLKEDASQFSEDVNSLCENYLYKLAKGPMKFGSVDGCYERMTLYAHSSNGSFIPIGRVSYNPEYSKKGRISYPDNQGCIAKAWRDDWHFSNDYPDPETSSKRYYQRCEKDGVPEGVMRTIKMKSRLYCGFRIWDSSGIEPLAVLIAEATHPNRYEEDELKAIFQKEQKWYMAELIIRVRQRIPDFKEAKLKGF